jgi:SAM-dependent methyltransferase
MKWHFNGSGSALSTGVGRKDGDVIHMSARRGVAWSVFGDAQGKIRARVLLETGGFGTVLMEITADRGATRLAHARLRIEGQRTVQQEVELPGNVEGLEVRIFCRGRCQFTISGLELDLVREQTWSSPDSARPVGTESGKSYPAKIADGFIDRYLSGPAVMEVGYRGYDHETVPIVPQAVGVDVGYPGYDGKSFPFSDKSLDAIYSSHCYEHIPDYREVLRDWYRLLKVGGFLIIVVPHQHLFERKRQMPSRWNPDHKRFYTPRSLLGEIEHALDENSYRIRHLVENDAGFDYRPTPREASSGCYEIELVLERIAQPGWVVDDGAVRPYPPADFQLAALQERISPYEVRINLQEVGHLVWGPYNTLIEGRYEADFFFDTESNAPIDLVLEVAREGHHLATAHVQLPETANRHHVSIPFTAENEGGFYEFRVLNRQAQTGVALTFRGVELRHSQ